MISLIQISLSQRIGLECFDQELQAHGIYATCATLITDNGSFCH